MVEFKITLVLGRKGRPVVFTVLEMAANRRTCMAEACMYAYYLFNWAHFKIRYE